MDSSKFLFSIKEVVRNLRPNKKLVLYDLLDLNFDFYKSVLRHSFIITNILLHFQLFQ